MTRSSAPHPAVSSPLRTASLAWILAATTLSSAHAIPSLFSSFRADSARTLPKGRYYLSYTRLSVPIDSRFSASGKSEGISREFSRDIKWSDVIEGRPDRSAQVAGLLESHGLAADGSAGEVYGDLKGRLNLTVPVAGYGITDRLGIFVAVPIHSVRIESKVAYRRSAAAQGLVDDLSRSEQGASAGEMAASLNEGFDDQIAKAGYRYREHIERSEIGDLRFEIPYVFDRAGGTTGTTAFAIFGSVVAPTGSSPDPAELYPLSSGQGRWMAGGRGVVSRRLGNRFELHASLGALVPFAGRRAVRVPRAADDKLSPNIDGESHVTGGVMGTARLQGEWHVSRSWTLSSGLEHQRKAKERYRGGQAVAGGRYDLLSDRTDERLDSYFINLDLNTIPAFLAGDFLFPIQFAVGYAAPIAGRNALAEPYGFLQSSLFFLTKERRKR